MTTPAVQYGRHASPLPGTACSVCGTVLDTPYMDHCHTHGWVRGAVCPRCNNAMAAIDRSHEPPGFSLEALIRHAARCHECPPVEPDALTLGHPRYGGWPGAARPDWQFRPMPSVQEYVEAYATRLGISRSAAINAIISEHIHEEPS